MDPLAVVALVFRWVHVLSAVLGIGGAMFVRLALIPAAATLEPAAHDQLREAVRAHWARWLHAAVGLLLVSGLVNFGLKVVKYQLPPTYHMVFGIKFLLALAVMAIASILVGRSALAQKMRASQKFWLNVNLALAVTVICLSGYLRSIDPPLKVAKPAAASMAAVEEAK